MNYYRRYVGDYLKKTIRLSMLEHGAYGLLLDYYYAEEKPIPTDSEEIYVICRAFHADYRKAVDKVLAAYFQRRDDGWHNQRADEEIAAAVQARENGGRGGRPKTGKQTERQTGTITGTITGDGGAEATGTGHPPTTNHQPPATSLNPLTPTQGQPRSAGAAQKARVTRRGNGHDEAPTAETWNAYSAAYLARYGVEPKRNATVNGQLAHFIARIGASESPAVAAFYVSHCRAFYVQKQHPVGLMLQDAEGLHTQWLSGRSVTETEARQADRTAATGNVFGKLIADAET